MPNTLEEGHSNLGISYLETLPQLLPNNFITVASVFPFKGILPPSHLYALYVSVHRQQQQQQQQQQQIPPVSLFNLKLKLNLSSSLFKTL